MSNRPGDNYDYPFILTIHTEIGPDQWTVSTQQFNAYTIQEAERMITAAMRSRPESMRIGVIRLW